MIDTNEIFKQAKKDPIQLAKWLPLLEQPECAEAAVNVISGGSNIGLSLIMLANQEDFISIFKSLMVYAFEAGRIYGQLELTESTFNLAEKEK